MSTSQRSEPGTAVTRQEQRGEQLSNAGRQQLAEIRAQNALVMTITSESWGNKMTPNMRRAFAEYMRRFKLDISEVDNLGGKPYRNGRYYERRIAEMRTRGLVEWTSGEHIGPDPRLEKLAANGDEWARAEMTRRTRECIRWAVPEDATHAYVCRVKLKGDQNPLEGCDFITPLRMKTVAKWENGRKVGTEQKAADPVGAEEPEKTVITRAWRRVGLLAASEIPELRAEEYAMDVGATEVADVVEQIAEEESERDEEVLTRHPRQMIAASSEPGDYGMETNPAPQPREITETRVAQPVTDAQRAAAEQGAQAQDPYGEGERSEARGTERSGSSVGGGERGGSRGSGARTSSSSVDPSALGGLATPEQKKRISELLMTEGLDLDDREIAQVAKISGAPSYPARDAVREIARLEKLVPGGDDTLFGNEA